MESKASVHGVFVAGSTLTVVRLVARRLNCSSWASTAASWRNAPRAALSTAEKRLKRACCRCANSASLRAVSARRLASAARSSRCSLTSSSSCWSGSI